ncbi:MAG: HAD hydrolase-like protein [Lachnospiraceae bacterium]|jgi:phosphoglycolate phosphatase|nr:HAD hydrolase-like protein [Lachnospiraceae bacterium]
MFDYCLFDLDGTLTDPREGITKSVQYALQAFGIEEPDLKKLEPFIGPPLKDSFMEFYGFTGEEAERAIAVYRERFAPVGIFENQVYPGIPQMLERLYRRGTRLAVASSKPIGFVKQILAHFDIEKYFDVVVGSELDGTRGTKEEVVEEALGRLGILTMPVTERHVRCAMTGDRKFDIQGARVCGLTGVGVRFGFAEEGELEEAGAEYIAETVAGLAEFLLRKA